MAEGRSSTDSGFKVVSGAEKSMPKGNKTSDIRRYISSNRRLQDEIDELKSYLEEKLSKYQIEIANLKHVHKDEMDKRRERHENEITELRKQIKQLETTKSKQEKEIETMKCGVESKNSDYQMMKADFKNEMKGLIDTMKNELRTEITKDIKQEVKNESDEIRKDIQKGFADQLNALKPKRNGDRKKQGTNKVWNK